MAGLQHTISSVDLQATDDQKVEADRTSSTSSLGDESSLDSAGLSQRNEMPEEDTISDPAPAQTNGNAEEDAPEREPETGDVVMMDIQQAGVIAAEVDVDLDEDADRSGEDSAVTDLEAGPSHEGKRVKVYELRDSSWFDRGTGFCKGIYDDSQDLALLIVEPEEGSIEDGKAEEPGGFFKNAMLLSARVEKEDIYGKQQDTLIVWTEPATGLDIALSFQDAEGCEDIWQFICEVQRHLINMSESESQAVPSSSSPVSGSPVLGPAASQMQSGEARLTWEVPTLANIREQEVFIRMQSKSPAGRERAVEHILNEDYIRHLLTVLEQAEDLESLEDLHCLCLLMQTMLLFNDNGILEYILHDDMFMGVIGMLEYDPEFPGLKASYRQFFQETARFRQVVEIKDVNIRNKIHQTYRLLYLKDVVLARVLDDPTFNILNGFVFFNQVDIINYIQQDGSFLTQLFEGFKDLSHQGSPTKDEPLDEKKRDVVMFLHQLMIMGKGIQVPGRLALYRNLVERGLLFVCEWAFRRTEAQLLHAGAEILTLAVEHDANIVRLHVFKEDEAKKRTLVMELIGLLHSTKNMGLMSQMSDTLRTLLESPPEEGLFARVKDGALSDSFGNYFYENCAVHLFKPLLDAPDIKADIAKGKSAKLPREHCALLQNLVELLSFCIVNHAHRANYFILSNPISKKIVSLLYVKDKPLRHAALRFVRACLKTPNHFIHRYFVKNDLLLPVLDMLEEESTRDNMMSSACMEVLELIRKENLKTIINYLFDTYRDRIERLAERPFLRVIINGLRSRWEINNEPPPPPPETTMEAESSKSWTNRAAAEEEDYFNGSDSEEEIGPKPPGGTETGNQVAPQKRKRMFTHGGGPKKRPSGARAPTPGSNSGSSGSGSGGALGLDYDDGSDSDSSSGAQSPRNQVDNSALDSESSPGGSESKSSTKQGTEKASSSDVTVTEELEEDLGDVAMRMRAKRQREEEEEEGFAGLLVGAGAAGSGGGGSKSPSTDTTLPAASTTSTATSTTPTKSTAASKTSGTPADSAKKDEKKAGVTPAKEVGKKIKLNFGGLSKKLGGGK